MLRSSVPEKSKLSIAFSKLYHSSAKKSMRLEKKREKCRFHGLGILGKPISYGSARLGHIPSLPWESQLPLKPCISLQPLDFKSNCDSSDCFLDVCFISWCSFDLLRKCGLLAHTSPTFLKNCWIKKLSFACGLVFAANVLKTACFYTLFHMKQSKHSS